MHPWLFEVDPGKCLVVVLFIFALVTNLRDHVAVAVAYVNSNLGSSDGLTKQRPN
jgi:hypothetical protein